MRKPLISVILPTYNESGNIISLISQIQKQLDETTFEIVVVDDNSPDQTAQKVNAHFGKKVRLIVRKSDHGLAKSIQEGISKSSGTYIIVMDTDFNHDPEDLPRFLALKRQFDLIVGSRYVKGGGMENKIRYILSLLYNLSIHAILALPTYDNLSGFFLINRNKLYLLPADAIFIGYGDYFIRLLHYACKRDFRIKEIPVYYKNRVSGTSKSKFFPMFLEYSKTVLRVLWNE